MVKLSPSQIAGIVKYESVGSGASFANVLKNPDTDGPLFVAIALAESSGETTATHKNHNGSTDYGLWQINSVHKDLLDRNQPWSDPKNNYHIAHELYWNRGGKFQDWSTFNSGIYATRLAEATTAWSNPDMTATDPNAIHDAANTAGSVVTGVADFLGAITKSSTWIRVGMGAAGVLLLIIAAAAVVKRNLPGPLGAAMRVAQAATPPTGGA